MLRATGRGSVKRPRWPAGPEPKPREPHPLPGTLRAFVRPVRHLLIAICPRMPRMLFV